LIPIKFQSSSCVHVYESLQGGVGIALESPDQKTPGFVDQIAFLW
jgi:hypothetical protein